MWSWPRASVYELSQAPNIRYVHSDRYRPYAYDKPFSVQNITEFCPHLVHPSKSHDNRDWRFCDGTTPGTMAMHVIMQKDGMFDRGADMMGATFDARRVYLMAHPFRPKLHMQNVVHYPRLAQALEPYAGEAQSHFWFGTVQHVLTLYDALPEDVPIVVAWSNALAKLYDMLDLNMSRIIPFHSQNTYHAGELYSVVYEPWSRHVQGGEPVSPQSFVRLKNHLKWIPLPRAADRPSIVLIDRADRGVRRCRNHEQLAATAERFVQNNSMQLTRFVGDRFSMAEARAIFQGTKLVVAPHGGALLNIVFMAPQTGVVEIGYYERNAMNYRSMRFPPWYFVMAKHLGLHYSLVMAPGSYNGHIDCPVDSVVSAMSTYFRTHRSHT